MRIFVRTIQGLNQAIGPHRIGVIWSGNTRVSLDKCEKLLNYQTLLRALIPLEALLLNLPVLVVR